MRRQKGFTLIEFLIVLAIIGIIASIAIPSLIHAQRTVASLNEFGCPIGDLDPICVEAVTRRVTDAEAANNAAWQAYQDATRASVTVTPADTTELKRAALRADILRRRQLHAHREVERIKRMADFYLQAAKQ